MSKIEILENTVMTLYEKLIACSWRDQNVLILFDQDKKEEKKFFDDYIKIKYPYLKYSFSKDLLQRAHWGAWKIAICFVMNKVELSNAWMAIQGLIAKKRLETCIIVCLHHNTPKEIETRPELVTHEPNGETLGLGQGRDRVFHLECDKDGTVSIVKNHQCLNLICSMLPPKPEPIAQNVDEVIKLFYFKKEK